jgi:cytochrome P450
VTAVTFTERNNQLVWKASLAQAHGMLQYWTERSTQPIHTISEDTRVFTLNVFAASLFSREYPFESQQESLAKAKAEKNNQELSYQYRDSLSKILQNIVPILICGSERLKSRWLPKSWREAGNAVSNFRVYVTELINEERAHRDGAQNANGDGVRQSHDLVSALIRACEADKNEDGRSMHGQDSRKMTLTEQEIVSNLFVYAFTGNDTTAITLAHLLVNLAANPQTQEWIAEEICHYLPGDDFTQWSYQAVSKLKRCQAVLVRLSRLQLMHFQICVG